MHLNLFVYGSLKRGYEYHDRFCGGAVSITEATVRGRLYDMPTGYAALAVPGGAIHLTGTSDPVTDAEAAADIEPVAAEESVDDRDVVRGELYVFDDPGERLPGIDRLEGFDPEGDSNYLRVLIPVVPAGETGHQLAWTYVAASEPQGLGVYLPGGSWPARREG